MCRCLSSFNIFTMGIFTLKRKTFSTKLEQRIFMLGTYTKDANGKYVKTGTVANGGGYSLVGSNAGKIVQGSGDKAINRVAPKQPTIQGNAKPTAATTNSQSTQNMLSTAAANRTATPTSNKTTSNNYFVNSLNSKVGNGTVIQTQEKVNVDLGKTFKTANNNNNKSITADKTRQTERTANKNIAELNYNKGLKAGATSVKPNPTPTPQPQNNPNDPSMGSIMSGAKQWWGNLSTGKKILGGAALAIGGAILIKNRREAK